MDFTFLDRFLHHLWTHGLKPGFELMGNPAPWYFDDFSEPIQVQAWAEMVQLVAERYIQRYGINEGLVDFGQGKVIAFADLVEEILGLIAEDAAFFNCEHYINHARSLLKRGTSAQQQRHLYNTARQQGKSKKQALEVVTQWLMEKTVHFT